MDFRSILGALMRVFDGFTFFNEMDLLELRLRELWDVVDHFVLVEGTRTFQKNPKPLYFQQNRDRFKKYESKIIHIIVDKYPTFWSQFRPVKTWHYENHQREMISQGLRQAEPEDAVLINDVDEIPNPADIQKWKDKPGIKVFEHFQSYYYLNYVCTRINDYEGKAVAQRNRGGFGRWRGSVMLPKKMIKSIKETRNYRDEERPGIFVVPESGWHFSNMGGVEAVLYKMKSWAHKEYAGQDFTDIKKLATNILEGRDSIGDGAKYELMSLSDSRLPWPRALLKDPIRWSSMLMTPERLQTELAPYLDK